MILHPGVQDRFIYETTLGAGTTSKEGSIQSDSLLATLWIDSITSGTLSVSVYTLTDSGKEVLLFSFPTIAAPSTELLLKKSGTSLQRFRIVATYTGVCNYEVYVRAVEGAGDSGSSSSESAIVSYTIDNVSVPTQDTEVPIVVPTDVIWLEVYNRTDGLTKLAFTPGDSGTLYSTLNPGDGHEYMKKSGEAMTLYVQCPKAGQIIEVTYGHSA